MLLEAYFAISSLNYFMKEKALQTGMYQQIDFSSALKILEFSEKVVVLKLPRGMWTGLEDEGH